MERRIIEDGNSLYEVMGEAGVSGFLHLRWADE